MKENLLLEMKLRKAIDAGKLSPENYKDNPVIYYKGMDVKMTPENAAIIAWHEGREAARCGLGAEEIPLMRKHLKPGNQRKLQKYKQFITSHNPGVMWDERKILNSYYRRYGMTPDQLLMFGQIEPEPHHREDIELERYHMKPRKELEKRKEILKNL